MTPLWIRSRTFSVYSSSRGYGNCGYYFLFPALQPWTVFTYYISLVDHIASLFLLSLYLVPTDLRACFTILIPDAHVYPSLSRSFLLHIIHLPPQNHQHPNTRVCELVDSSDLEFGIRAFIRIALQSISNISPFFFLLFPLSYNFTSLLFYQTISVCNALV